MRPKGICAISGAYLGGLVKPFVVTLALAGAAFAQQASPGIPKIKFSDATLDNGLRVLISEDHYAPVYAICISYKVGSRDERPGRTGFAHLFEHMMFKGSENVGTGELDFPHLQQRRQLQRHHQYRSHLLLRSAAEEPGGSGPLSRSRPHAWPGDHAGESRKPAAGREGRAPPARGQSGLRPNVRESGGVDLR
jgi:hypothetical protein